MITKPPNKEDITLYKRYQEEKMVKIRDIGSDKEKITFFKSSREERYIQIGNNSYKENKIISD